MQEVHVCCPSHAQANKANRLSTFTIGKMTFHDTLAMTVMYRSDGPGSSLKWLKCQNVNFLDTCLVMLTDNCDIDVMDVVHPTMEKVSFFNTLSNKGCTANSPACTRLHGRI